jgi:hypothetical protein
MIENVHFSMPSEYKGHVTETNIREVVGKGTK